jgi:hypothetical protein
MQEKNEAVIQMMKDYHQKLENKYHSVNSISSSTPSHNKSHPKTANLRHIYTDTKYSDSNLQNMLHPNKPFGHSGSLRGSILFILKLLCLFR